jgi:serine/threonine-protein phosphatase 6 regulatory subunit 3
MKVMQSTALTFGNRSPRGRSLEELLLDEEIVDDCEENDELIEFLSEEVQMKKLIGYVTCDVKNLQYSTIAGSILSKSNKISSILFEKEDLLLLLLQVIERDAPICSLSIDLISSIFVSLIYKNADKIIELIMNRKNFMNSLYRHFTSINVVKLFCLMLSKSNSDKKIEKIFMDENVVQFLLEKLQLDDERQQSLSSVIVHMIQNLNPTNEIKKLFETEDFINKLFQISFNGNKDSFTIGFDIVFSYLNSNIGKEEIPLIYEITLGYMQKFKEILNEVLPKIRNSTGEIEPLGWKKLKVVELFSVLLKGNYTSIDQVLEEFGITELLLNIFFKYSWNNILHSLIFKIISLIMDGTSYEKIREQLIYKYNLLDKLILLSSSNVSNGYVGHLTQITSLIEEKAKNNDKLSHFLTNNCWENHINGRHKINIENQKYINNKRTVGIRKHKHSSDDSDSSDSDDFEIEFSDDDENNNNNENDSSDDNDSLEED